MSKSGWAVRREERREVGSGRGRAMRRCSFAGPPPIVVDVLGVGCWVFCGCSLDASRIHGVLIGRLGKFFSFYLRI